jgi:hypothetical protein
MTPPVPPPRTSGGTKSRPVAPVSLTLESITADPEVKERARAVALEFFRSKLDGKRAAPAIRRVTRLKWHKSLTKAAAQATREGKPIFFIQALGDLTGFT